MRTRLAGVTAGVAVTVLLGLLSGLAMAVAVWLMTTPDPPSSGDFLLSDKLWHALAFAGLVLPASLAMPPARLLFFLAHLLVLAVGFEWVQAVGAGGREASFLDGLANITGLCVGAMVGGLIRRLVVGGR
jgi:hypothetical protein